MLVGYCYYYKQLYLNNKNKSSTNYQLITRSKVTCKTHIWPRKNDHAKFSIYTSDFFCLHLFYALQTSIKIFARLYVLESLPKSGLGVGRKIFFQYRVRMILNLTPLGSDIILNWCTNHLNQNSELIEGLRNIFISQQL